MSDGLFGFLGVLVGALLQFWLGRRAGIEAHYLELKSTAYADYVNAVGAVAFAEPSERKKALEMVTAAKSRICVFGDSKVIEALVRLEETSLNLSLPAAQSAFIELLQVMREHGIPVGRTESSNIKALLLPNS